MMAHRDRSYSTWGRPFRLRLTAEAASGFDAPASRGACQFPDCDLFEWCNGALYCRDHWLSVYQRDQLPDRDEWLSS